MKIERVQRVHPDRNYRNKWCSEIVEDPGLPWRKENRTCKRVASFKIEGAYYCTMHAGFHALDYLVNKK